jgi:hypothetical protein
MPVKEKKDGGMRMQQFMRIMWIWLLHWEMSLLVIV